MTKRNDWLAEADAAIDKMDSALLGRIFEREAEVDRAFDRPKKLVVKYTVRRKGVEITRQALVPYDEWMAELPDATLYRVAEALNTRPGPGNPGTTRRVVKHHDAAITCFSTACDLLASDDLVGGGRSCEEAIEMYAMSGVLNLKSWPARSSYFSCACPM
jgi:hypothetical protein